MADLTALFAWGHGDCAGTFAFHERLPAATVYACPVCGQHRVAQDNPAAAQAALAALADYLVEAADANADADYQAGWVAGREAAEGFADVLTHTLAAPAGTSDMFKAGWRVGFAEVRNRKHREAVDA